MNKDNSLLNLLIAMLCVIYLCTRIGGCVNFDTDKISIIKKINRTHRPRALFFFSDCSCARSHQVFVKTTATYADAIDHQSVDMNYSGSHDLIRDFNVVVNPTTIILNKVGEQVWTNAGDVNEAILNGVLRRVYMETLPQSQKADVAKHNKKSANKRIIR